MRFDEIELQVDPFSDEMAPAGAASESVTHAPRIRRLLALVTDLSLFVALSLALSPLLPSSAAWPYTVALGGFVVVVSYYYFVGSWLLWGKTIGGAIFDVRIVPHGTEAMSVRVATLRWAGVCAALVTAGCGFALAALPSRRSLPDRLSATRAVVAN